MSLAVVSGEVLVDVREPTLADVVAWLQRSPATYLQLLETAQVGLPWETWRAGWYRWRGGLGTAEAPAPLGHVWLSDAGAWRGSVLGVDLVPSSDEDLPAEWATADEARAAVDRVLSELGWTLAGGVTP